MKRIALILAMCSLFGIAQTKSIEKRTYTSSKVTNEILIDGIISEGAWENVQWQGDFIQFEPFEGKQPSQETKFKIVYDDNNLYLAIKCFDTAPDSIEYRLSRRDGFDGDWVEVNIDSYFDKRTAFSFTISAAGVKGDELISNDGNNWDSTWDPIWYAKTSTDNEGWNAEIRIPFSQLRFGEKDNQVWGIQVQRRLFRHEERSIWQFISRENSGWVSRFGELHGISDIEPKRQVDVTPYALAKVEKYEKEEGNPFRTGQDFSSSYGVDGKIGLTNDLTLDFTINPDFGQVEADPSEVNLTAFETYFQEKRPFFVEGKNIMNYNITSGGGDLSRDNLFYSRRIGRSPQHYPDLNDDEYAEVPQNTSILGAFKVSGKTQNGWSVGFLESITQREEAEIKGEGDTRYEEVEPFTNYLLGRVQKDINKGNTIVGGMFTATNRDITNPDIDYLHKSAYTGGFDFLHQWKDKTYSVQFKTIFSHVQGNESAILNTQTSSRHYFQRPDADHLSVDSNLTSLSGIGGTLQFSKSGTGRWRMLTWITYRSPGLELNDMGYLRQGDQIQQVFWLGYFAWEPEWIFRNYRFGLDQWQGMDFGGQHKYYGLSMNASGTFTNYWDAGTGFNYNGPSNNTTFLRGGPMMKTPGRMNNWINIGTDSRKKVTFHTGAFNSWGTNNYARSFETWLSIRYRPSDAILLSVNPSFNIGRNDLQYVSEVEVNESSQDILQENTRYLISTINQKTMVMSFRINYSITPDLTIQYYGQPFLSAGKYSNYKYITDPIADNYSNRFNELNAQQLSYNETDEIFMVDENRDNISDYSFDKPDYNAFFFLSNLVVRWEYNPGSSLFLVWSQNRSEYSSVNNGEFDFKNDVQTLYDVKPYNVFLVKLSYRFGL